jgi:hypothetical protein
MGLPVAPVSNWAGNETHPRDDPFKEYLTSIDEGGENIISACYGTRHLRASGQFNKKPLLHPS